MTQTPDSKPYIETTPLARAVINSFGWNVTGLSNKLLYKIRHSRHTSENTRDSDGEPLVTDVTATDVTIKFLGTRHEMLKKLRDIGIRSSDIGGPFKEGDLERWAYFQAPCQDSGIHQTSVTIYCKPAKF